MEVIVGRDGICYSYNEGRIEWHSLRAHSVLYPITVWEALKSQGKELI